MIDKAQEEVIMLFADDLFNVLQMTCSAAQVIVSSSLSWVSVLSVDFAKQAAEWFVLHKITLWAVAILPHIEICLCRS